jgi:tetratricopeptide (TPR) repeat protein
MSERTNELYILTQKAQKMEMINEEVALKIYLDIFENYTPKISKTYESAIRLLEKRQRFSEALKICDQAIDLINKDEVSGIVEKFDASKKRLERKIQEQGPDESEVVKKKFVLKKHHVILTIILIALVYFLVRFTTPYGDLNVDLEGKEALEGGEKVFHESTDPETLKYVITEDMIDVATREIKKNIEIKDAGIIPQKSTLGIAIIVSGGTTSERGKELAEAYLKSLAGAASATYSDLDGPTSKTLGEIYNYYELVITVGTGLEKDTYIAEGTKNKGSISIVWRKSR